MEPHHRAAAALFRQLRTLRSGATGSGDQLVDGPGGCNHAETGGHHGHRAEASGAVELDPLTNEALALAHAAVRLRVAQLLRGEHTGHAVGAPRRAREVVFATQQRAHLCRQRIVEGLVQISDLDLCRIDLPAGAAGGDDLDLATLAPGDRSAPPWPARCRCNR